MAEIAVVSARRARLQPSADAGDVDAQAVLKLSENPSTFLSTVQIGITLVGILAGAFSGATIADQLTLQFQSLPWLAPYAEWLSISLVVLFVTYLSLLIGELVPKRLALTNPEFYARLSARPMLVISRLTTPIVHLLSISSDLILRLLRVNMQEEPQVTEEEIRVMIQQGTDTGVFVQAEQSMVEGVFRLADRRVGTLITPRTEIVWLDIEDPPSKNWQKVIESGYTRFPISVGNLDEVLGVIQAKRLLAASLAGEPLDLRALMDEPILVPESLPALSVLELFEQNRQHIALVIDEFGGLQGLVTLNDIMQAIVGEMVVSNRPDELEIVQREDGSWLVDGLVAVDELKDLLKIANFPDEDEVGYQTVGGLVMARLGHIPRPSDHFDWCDYHFEVVDMDGLRVDKILVQRLPDPAKSENKF